ncbi:hypothetical protein RJ640_023028 [Escallonia rubra]|uniref:LTI65/LTI78 PGEED repeat domain-containing protein n=1 Tax=Escallonia rubra TaxID=112253 RepID=A0AA88QN71_9ASTE|nr:hypothetical protein RJ640_023028 [Escallonia rubra]
MSVYDDAKPGQEQNKYTGGHDQSSPRPNPTTIPTDAGNPISGPKSFGASNPEDLPRDTTTGTPTDQGSYVGKISSATSAIDGKAVSAKNVVASKLGYGGGGETESREKHGGETAKSASPTEYAQKNAATVTEKWAPVYEKVADTGSSVISKVPGIGTQPSPRPNPTTIPTDAGNPISGPKSFGASNPEDLPRDTTTGTPTDQGSYVGKISSATSVIAGKAVSAKNVVASKLGYGGGGETESREKHGGGETAKSASPTEYAQKIAATAPVHEKVADTGSSVISKVPGIGTGTGTTRTETERDTDLGDKKGPDKGVSVKEYFAEKLRPGDEDKALSEVISDALHKRKEENGKDGPEEGKPVTDRPLSETISQAVSDGFDKREVDPEGAVERKQMGKVTESEEVARRLGTGNKEEEDDTSREIADSGVGGNVGVTSGVVDRVKGAVASWFGKGDASHASQESTGTTYAAGNEGLSRSEDAQGQEIAGERRLQESGN